MFIGCLKLVIGEEIILKNFNDGNRLPTLRNEFMYECPVGKGIVPVKEIVSILETNGYKGCYGIE